MSTTSGQTGSAPVAVGGGATSARSGGQASPAPRRLGLALVVIAAAQLMVVLDATIVNVALPHIQDALHFSGTNLEWVVNAYTLAFGGLLLLGGRMGDLLGRRRIFIAGIALFALASLAGGFATDEAWLIDLGQKGLKAEFIEGGKFKCALAQMASDTQIGAWGFTTYDQTWLPYVVLGGMTVALVVVVAVLLKRRDPV